MALVIVKIKFNKEEFVMEIATDATLADFKQRLFEVSRVSPNNQTFRGVRVKKGIPDNTTLEELKIRNNQKIMLIGTPDEEIVQAIEEDLTIVNDLDLPDDEFSEPASMPVYLDKVQKRIETYEMNHMNDPRPGKKLLVLDIDYTFFDHRSPASNPLVLKRPFMNEMLTAIYPYYDIMIWSATNMSWIELKLVELQVVPNDNYNITAYFDHRAMITVHTKKHGVKNTKPLPVIWGKYPEFYDRTNTIMFDDIRRNFIMNPENGLRIKAFRNAPVCGAEDKELFFLTQYLLLLKDEEDFSAIDHQKWKRYVRKNKGKLLNFITDPHQN
eukprot:TRINITY_DN11974_c0_g1_i1.p1 TRINITY_DN11974_c0_g1~~TRINITY_DN11974_c0_g1_i1.p1  ORF type:complete len:340 (-),score=72.01 TRINITY_DN11974_c0_g1_i1:73-1053(-)